MSWFAPVFSFWLGLWVHFDPSLILAYDVLMLYFFEVALSWAYLPDDNPLPKEYIKQVLVNHKTLDGKLPGVFLSLALRLWKVALAYSTAGMGNSIHTFTVECNKRWFRHHHKTFAAEHVWPTLQHTAKSCHCMDDFAWMCGYSLFESLLYSQR